MIKQTPIPHSDTPEEGPIEGAGHTDATLDSYRPATNLPDGTNETATEHGPVDGDNEEGNPVLFPRRVIAPDSKLVTDTILPEGVLLEFVSVDLLNAFINYVDLQMVITERDPEEDERYITQSNRFYTHFHEFGTVVHVIASSASYWWYFCYDIDASDCAIGRTSRGQSSLDELSTWVSRRRLTGQYPVKEIDVTHLQGWRSFQ